MHFWDQTIEEFRRLLLRAGSFRRVIRYDLEAGQPPDGPLALRRLPDRRVLPVNVFLRGPEQRLVLFFTDALSPAWEDGRILRLLAAYARRRVHATVFHLLPPEMWRATEIAGQRVGRVHSPRPGLLRWVAPPAAGGRLGRDPMVLLAGFAPDYVQHWARTLAAFGVSRTTAFVPTVPPARPPVGAAAAGRPLRKPREALAAFQATASPLAVRLAGHLAAAPLYPPVMRLVQQALLPSSTREHLAEVLLGGLLYRPPEENVGDPPAEETLYEFLPGQPDDPRGVRELLLDEEWTPDLEAVLRAVSQHVESRFGRDALNFTAILEHPRALGRFQISKNLRHFARVGAAVLRRFGGEDAEVGQQIESALVDPALSLPPRRPGRYALLLGRKPGPSDGLDALQRALENPEVGNFVQVERGSLDEATELSRRLVRFFKDRVSGDVLLIAFAGPPSAARVLEPLGDAWPTDLAARTILLGEVSAGLVQLGWPTPASVMRGADLVTIGPAEGRPGGGFLRSVAALLEGGWADRLGRGYVTIADVHAAMQAASFCRDAGRPTGLKLNQGAVDIVLARNPRYRSIPDLGLEFLRVPAGRFVMGSPETEAERSEDERQHQVTITHDFFLGVTPVTQAAWAALMESGESPVPNPSQFKGDPTRPVDSVSWDEAREFCRRLTEREHREGRLPEHMVYSLPTEAEWEYACRAGTTTPFAIGDGQNLTPDIANFDGNYPYGPTAKKGEYRRQTTPVKSFSPNPWGFYDMHGNVFEWCEDRYGDYRRGVVVDPLGPTEGAVRVRRGGSWGSFAWGCRSAYRIKGRPVFRDGYTGFRIAAVQAASRQGTRAPEARSGAGGAGASDGPRALEFAEIKPGTFLMGSPEDEAGRDSDETQHTVTLTRSFRIGRYPVTQQQYEAVMGTKPSSFKKAGPDAPVETVSWDEAMEFCRRLTERDRKTGRLPEGWIYTLPTEAQWEYACRAGSAGAIYSDKAWVILGQNNAPVLDRIAWYGGNSGVEYEGAYDSSGWSEKQYDHKKAGTHPVGLKQPNAWGLHDMLGNVLEWCWDWSGEYPKGAVVDPTGPTEGAVRVLRGGCWFSFARRCRSARRGSWRPEFRGWFTGFRVAAVQAVESGSGEGRATGKGVAGRARSPAERGAAARPKTPGGLERPEAEFRRNRK